MIGTGSLIHEVLDELHEIITNINRAFIDGEFDDHPDPMTERDTLIQRALLDAPMVLQKEGR